MKKFLILMAVVTALVLVIPVAQGSVLTIPTLYKNCTNLNKKYPHGVGKATARDKTSGTPVMTFKRSTKIYNIAMSYNKRLDGDKDGIACEKA
jgi:hypothetical protein